MAGHTRRTRNIPPVEVSGELRSTFEQLLGTYDYNFKKGDIINGTVITEDGGSAYIDIGAKTLAYLPGKEGGGSMADREILAVGDSYEFFILREENEDGQLTLSRRRVSQAQNWTEIETIANSDTVIECQVLSTVKGGLLIDVFGLRGFVPSSHLRLKGPVEEIIGKKLPFKILSLDKARNNIILSHRKVLSEQMAEQRRELFTDLTVGNVIEGDVVRLTDFGAFVDLGGVDGLLPLSQMSWRWVEHPSDILKVGDKVKVEVIALDPEKHRISLSIKSQHPDPWTQVIKEISQGQKVKGTITRIKHFGAFVEIFPGVEALLPSRDIADYQAQNGKQLASGDEIETFVVKFTPEERRISLSFSENNMMPNEQPALMGQE